MAVANRKDAWHEDEDLVLAEMVLKHIREGSTQTKAFEQAGKKLNRTSMACSVRWNSALKSRFEQAISLAKKSKQSNVETQEQKQEKPKQQKQPVSGVQKELEDAVRVISYHLKQYVATTSETKPSTESAEELKREIEALKQENEKLKEDYRTIQEDYHEMAKIFDKAKQMIS